jgi:hypothetical protein
MSVSSEGGTIRLEGRCPAEDAEDLLCALQAAPGASVDIAKVQRLHMAVLQVLLALRPGIRGRPDTGLFSQDIPFRLIFDDTAAKNS